MKQKYITTQTRLACLSQPMAKKKNIYTELAETIAERKKIMEQLSRLYEQRKSPVFIWSENKAA